MALTAGELQILVTANTQQIDALNAKLKGLQGKAQQTQGGFLKLAGAFGVANVAMQVGAKAIQFLTDEIKKNTALARDFQESQNKLSVTFSSVSKEANKMRDNLNRAFGLSKKQATELLGSTGDLLTGFGFTQKASLNLSNQVQELSADLASFQNLEGGVERASQALTKALLGETESAKALGIVIRETDVQARLAEKGLKGLTGEALLQEKAQIRLQIALDQSKNAIGDLDRTSDSLANRQRRLSAVQEDIRTAFGSTFTDLLNTVTGSVLKTAESFRDWIEDANNLKIIRTVINGVAVGVFALVKVVELNWKIWKAFIDLIVIGIQAFKDLLEPLTFLKTTVIDIAKLVGESFVKAWDFALQILDKVIAQVSGVLDLFGVEFPNNLKSLGTTASETFDKIAEGISTKIPDNVKKAGETIKTGLGNVFEDLKDPIDDVINFAAEAFGNIDKKLDETKTEETAAQKGKKTGEEFAKGLKEGLESAKGEIQSAVIDTLSSIANTVTAAISEAFQADAENRLTALESQNEKELELIDERLQREIELLENNGMTKAETEQAEIDRLNELIMTRSNAKEQEVLQDQVREIEKARQIRALEDQAVKEKEKREKKLAKDKHKIDVEVFNSKKAADLATAGISLAQSIANSVLAATSAAAAAGPAAPAVFAAVFAALAALSSASIGAQIGVIAAKQPPPPPKFAQGTVSAPGGISIVGEEGPELVNLPRGAGVKRAFNSRQGFGETMINAVFMIDGQSIPINTILLNNKEVSGVRV